MQNRYATLGICFLIAALLWSCAAGISRESKDQVSYSGNFSELQAKPQSYIGRVAIFGGKVLQTMVDDNVTEIMLLQFPLNRKDSPVNSDQSEGRFIVRSAKFIDPALYPAGTRITMVGRLVESRALPIGKMDYQYPVFELIEIKKWSAGDFGGPRFHFGIGVGTTF